ncbi:DUF4270 domain-containing protein [Flavobacterium sp. j3]|uniref:DUF4270 domain-containing protein n=1 Tax=Flavobacterium aureirubrum TaxID=3133147 RepID=A0ABU9N6Z3_9FLAO
MFKKSFFQSILFVLIPIVSLVSCDKDFNEIGADIVGDDHFTFEKYTGATVKSYNQKIGAVSSNNLAINQLGFYDNPPFGTTQANFVTQVELSVSDPKFNNVDPENYDVLPTVLDSVVLEVPYFSTIKSVEEVQVNGKTERRTTYELDSIYGVEGSKFKLSVYQSNYYLRNLDPNESLGQVQLFYTDQNTEIDNNKIPVLLNDLPTSDPRNADGRENTQFYFDKREHKTVTFEEDGVTPINTRSRPSMRLHLRNDVFNAAILNAPSGQLANNNVFKNFFRGIYFKTESIGNPGNMASLNFKEGKITLYYNEDTKKTSSQGDITYERTNKSYVLNLNGNTINLLNNSNENQDYLNATLLNNSQEASQLFIKGGQGSIAVIDVFGPDSDNNGIADEIEVIKANRWLINEASLTFYIDKQAMSDGRTIEPNRIFLYDLTNNQPIIDYNRDLSNSTINPKFNKINYGGVIEKENVANGRGTRYKIRITNHLRNLITRDSTNVRLGLSVTENINNIGFSRLKVGNTVTNRVPSMSVMSPLGTILFGSNPSVPEEKRLKLEIYYTKPN